MKDEHFNITFYVASEVCAEPGETMELGPLSSEMIYSDDFESVKDRMGSRDRIIYRVGVVDKGRISDYIMGACHGSSTFKVPVVVLEKIIVKGGTE